MEIWQNVYPKNEFLKILERERVRTDRSGQEFSVIIFTSTDPIDHKTFVRSLLGFVGSRLRLPDLVGIIDQCRTCLFMPNTPGEGIHKIAHDILKRVNQTHPHTSFTIFTYPSHWISGMDLEDTSQREPADVTPVNARKHFLDELGPHMPAPYLMWKRALDITITCMGLIFVLPFLLILAAFIKTVSPGPIFFKQRRVGYLGKTFNCWKFRTMKINAETAVHQNHLNNLMNSDRPMHKLDDHDNRIIPLGRFIRKAGLDELPQLFNVIAGDMSLIGPRPCIPYEVSQFRTWQYRRLDTTPGISGLWQVSGKNRTTFDEMMRFDIDYIKRRSMLMDMKIILKTPSVILSQVFPRGGKRPQDRKTKSICMDQQ